MIRLALLLSSLVALLACSAEPDRPFCEPGRVCAAASPEHCANGIEAARYGRDTFADGTCIASAAGCAASSQACALWGQCHAPTIASPTGSCADDDRDFLASRDPACTQHTCVAVGDDCKAAQVCALEGRCTASNGVCVADAASCKASELCKKIGWCSLLGTQCRAASLADCAATITCREHGHCAFARGRCEECRRSAACGDEGLCYAFEGRCIAFTSRHCAASRACKQEGRCNLYAGACVR